MTINYSSRTIQMTKKFAKAAEKFGSDEYKNLQEARRDNPTFKVVIVARKAGLEGLNRRQSGKPSFETKITLRRDESHAERGWGSAFFVFLKG